MTLQVVGVVIAIVVVYYSIVAFAPVLSVPRQPLKKTKPRINDIATKPPRSRKDVSFQVKGTPISAWLYVPEDMSAPVPCIIMANGAGGTKDILLESYAVRFQQAGFAVLAFDYRHFGESGGEPRQLLWIPYQLEDYEAAVRYARDLKEIDPARIALWGTSASGGHVIVVAAKHKDIACVVAQCPGLDGHASGHMFLKRLGIGYILRMIMHGQRDMVRSWFRLSPHRIPIVGKPGSIAMMATSDAYDFFEEHTRESFVNGLCARIILRSGRYRPVKHAKNVRCPVLLQICDHDSFTPLSAAEETERELGKYVEAKHYPIGHFDIYTGDDFERSLSDQLAFFKKHL